VRALYDLLPQKADPDRQGDESSGVFLCCLGRRGDLHRLRHLWRDLPRRGDSGVEVTEDHCKLVTAKLAFQNECTKRDPGSTQEIDYGKSPIQNLNKKNNAYGPAV
jgi:hypothetical protein